MAIDPRLAAYFSRLGMSEEVAGSALEGWEISVAQRNGEDVGFVVVRGPEIHIISFNERKAMSRRNIAEYLNPLIEKYGYASTRVPVAEEEHRLRTKLGFVMTWEDKRFTYWQVTEPPFSKE